MILKIISNTILGINKIYQNLVFASTTFKFLSIRSKSRFKIHDHFCKFQRWN